MRFLKNIGRTVGRVARGVGRAVDIGEKVINAADKASGGLLRTAAATATGGLSEQALTAYKTNKGTIKKGIETTQRVSRIAERAGTSGSLVGSGAWSMAKDMAGVRGRDYMQQAEGLAAANPKIYGRIKPMI